MTKIIPPSLIDGLQDGPRRASKAATVSLDVPVPFSLELLCCVVVSCVASCFGTSLQQCEAIRSPLESHGVHWSPMEITNMRDSSRGGRPRLHETQSRMLGKRMRDSLHGGKPRPHEANPACSGGACGIRFMGGAGKSFEPPKKKKN